MRTNMVPRIVERPLEHLFWGDSSNGYESLVKAMGTLIDLSPLRGCINHEGRYETEKEEIARGVTADVLTSVPFERLLSMRDWRGVLRGLLEYKLVGVVNGFIGREGVNKPESENPHSEYSPRRVVVDYGGGLDSKAATIFSLRGPEDDPFEVLGKGGDGKSGLGSLATPSDEESGKPETRWSVGKDNISSGWAAYWKSFETQSPRARGTSGKRKKRTAH